MQCKQLLYVISEFRPTILAFVMSDLNEQSDIAIPTDVPVESWLR